MKRNSYPRRSTCAFLVSPIQFIMSNVRLESLWSFCTDITMKLIIARKWLRSASILLTVDIRLSEPRLSEPWIFRIEFQAEQFYWLSININNRANMLLIQDCPCSLDLRNGTIYLSTISHELLLYRTMFIWIEFSQLRAFDRICYSHQLMLQRKRFLVNR